MIVRRGTAADLAAAGAVWAAATSARDGGSATAEQGAQALAPVVERSDALLVVAIREDVVGFALAAPDSPGVAELHYLALDPSEWGRGTGGLLVDAVCGELVDEGFEQLLLWVYADNLRALALYERTGWRREPGSERVKPSTGRVEVRFRRP